MEKGKARVVEDNEQDQPSHKTSPEPEIRMDLEAEGWIGSKKGEDSEQDENPEGIDYTKDFS